MEDLDGIKMHFGDSAWLLVRASGTENLLRLYAETPSREQTKALLEAMAASPKGKCEAHLPQLLRHLGRCSQPGADS